MNLPDREIVHHYQDPIDTIWLRMAKELGIEVVRDDTVFASWNGNGVLTIGSSKSLDPDDCLAQMILHELSHAITEGEGSWSRPDWNSLVASTSIWSMERCIGPMQELIKRFVQVAM